MPELVVGQDDISNLTLQLHRWSDFGRRQRLTHRVWTTRAKVVFVNVMRAGPHSEVSGKLLVNRCKENSDKHRMVINFSFSEPIHAGCEPVDVRCWRHWVWIIVCATDRDLALVPIDVLELKDLIEEFMNRRL